MALLLAVEGLVVAYGRLRVLDGVDLGVPEGRVVALLGPNGAGKSTLLRVVAGLVPAEAGQVRLRGEPLDGLPAHARATRGITLIPEGRGIFPALTVAENLAVALGNDPVRIAKVTDFFPLLAERIGLIARSLSGGEQQMLALARAVAPPEAPDAAGAATLLMADELSLGLAPMLVNTMVSTLERLHREQGRTILLVEQYATHALRLADVVYILDRGQIAWAGEPEELRASRVLAESYLGT